MNERANVISDGKSWKQVQTIMLYLPAWTVSAGERLFGSVQILLNLPEPEKLALYLLVRKTQMPILSPVPELLSYHLQLKIIGALELTCHLCI